MKKTYSLHDIRQWEALKEEAQRSRGVVIFKLSPICPISLAAERELDAWYEGISEEANVIGAKIDVIASRPLSQHIAQELGVEHQSPQVIWITPQGKVQWHTSHRSITIDNLRSAIGL